jgi:hypothetical protein
MAFGGNDALDFRAERNALMLEYFRHRKKSQPFPTIWWPVAMPWGAFLTIMCALLMINPSWAEIASLSVETEWETDTTAEPLAVLRMRAGRAASLFYYRADKLPKAREALVRRDFSVIPAPPLPRRLRWLADAWILVEDEHELDAPAALPRKRFFGGAAARPPSAPIPDHARHKLLIAKAYRSTIDWDGIRQGLGEAQSLGIKSTLVFIEAEDQAQVAAILGAVDLCKGLGLSPVLRMQ